MISTATSFAYDNRQLAETYDRLSDLQFESGMELVRCLGDLDGARVLDVGCGTGRLAQWISELVGPTGTVVGIDPLAERIALARAHVDGVRFEVGRAENLDLFDAESFDAVCMSSVFHWVTDKPKALTEIGRVLRVGGKLGITTISRELGEVGTIGAVLNPLLRRPPYAGRVEEGAPFANNTLGLTTTELISTVLASGLELDELHITPRSWTHYDGSDFIDFIESSSFGNFLRFVPKELHDQLRADVAEAFEAHRGPNGTIRDWLTTLVARAVQAKPTSEGAP